MEDDQNNIEPVHKTKSRAPINVGAALLVFLFVWLVFDNIALGILAALFAGGGSELAQRAVSKKPK